jgi:SAM-dependent methyltransferase
MASVAVREGQAAAPIKRRYVATVFAGSFLLFLVQPMIARMALPRLGGAPAVWNSAMLVYQTLLLAGYGYAHWLGRFAPRRQAMIHLGAFALAAVTLPIALIAANPPPDANSFLWVPWLLFASIGPLFLVVSAQAPLMQRWFAVSSGGDPYPLYAASNFGSFLGLIAFPLVVEPLLPVASQSLTWSLGYGLLAVLVTACAFGLPRGAAAAPIGKAAPVSRRQLVTWIVLAAVPSGLMLSTTLHLTTDIVAMPLLWVVPLGLYLLSFSVAFAEDRRSANGIARIAPFALLIAACGVCADTTPYPLLVAGAALFALFAVSVAVHSALFDRRPDPSQLTTFYLAMSIGGALGGVFCALVAPLVFDWTYEHPVLLIAAALAIAAANPFARLRSLWDGGERARRTTRWAMIAILFLSLFGQGFLGMPNSPALALAAAYAILAIGVAAIGNRALLAVALAGAMLTLGGWEKLALSAAPGKMTRSFFGIYSIRPIDGNARMLAHGTTVHGVQNLGSPERERMATSYYAPLSGVGAAMRAAPRMFPGGARVGVVGLGAGTLACYARPDQRWSFYEIDPKVVAIARDPKQFTFLSRCLPGVPVALGDARLTLQREPPASADLLVVDAFSSDSVPMHLLTLEAFQVYRRHLTPDGLLMVHISNRYLDLQPVVAAAAAHGWAARIRTYYPGPRDRALHAGASMWVAMSPSPATIARLEADRSVDWRRLEPTAGFAPWTDDHASILPVIKWRG